MFRKVALLEILRSPILTGVQAYCLYASKNELLGLKLTENSQEVIISTVEFLSPEAGANRFSAE